MKFGPVPVGEVEGAILAHATLAGKSRLKKGTVLGDNEVASLREAGIETVIAAVLEAGDVAENEASARLGAAFAEPSLKIEEAHTGRVNILAANDGVLQIDKAVINAFNAVDPDVTIATLPEYLRVSSGDMVATIKIIPFAVAGTVLDKAIAIVSETAIIVRSFRPHRVGLIQTELPTTKPSVLDKTRSVTEARLARSGSSVGQEIRTKHSAGHVAKAITELAGTHDAVVIFGASAVSDSQDVIPSAIRMAGGNVERFGMPVDPGNLLVLGAMNGKPVLGAPGCARSPKENGFDWVIDRLFAGMQISGNDVASMGVGGLLKEMAARPQPRERASGKRDYPVQAIVLAAGQSSRAGSTNKLLAKFDGVPLVRMVVDELEKSKTIRTTVVTGYDSGVIEKALASSDCNIVLNSDYTTGMASSFKAGIGDLDRSASGAIIVLADMPGLNTNHVNHLIDAFAASNGQGIVRATYHGRPGNPVILPRKVLLQAQNLTGDIGARHLIEASDAEIVDVEIGEAAALDVDTVEAIVNAGGQPA